MGGDSDKSFWVTLPGILTGIAAIITAIGGILLAIHTIYPNVFGTSTPVTPTPVTPTPVTPTPVTPTPFPDNFTAISSPTQIQASTPTPTLTSTKAGISIIYPLDSTDVQMQETVKGTATNIPEGQQLWIVTRWYDNYYPQNYVDIQSDGSWELPVQIGEGDSHGSVYDIMAVLADKNAQNEFNNYLNTFEKTGVWPEMRKLPDGSKVKVSISVVRV